MTNPYDVLGISSSASDDEVKEAYRNLATKYHPDSYAESPLKDVAVQKKKEIDEAFESIMNERRKRGPVQGQTVDASATSNGGYQAAGGNSSPSNLGDIRRMIQQNRLVEAEELLDGVPANMRDGEWYFLKGSIYFSRGWLEDAANHFSSSCRSLLPFAACARKKAKRMHPEIDRIVGECMAEQFAVEHSDSLSVDRAAEPSARALSMIFAELSEQETEKKVLSRLGYLVGRYVYFIDALDDLEDDAKTGSYNIFYRRAAVQGTPDFGKIREYAAGAVNLTVGEIAAAYELLNIKRYKTILDNLIYLGLHSSLKSVIEKNQKNQVSQNLAELESSGKEIKE